MAAWVLCAVLAAFIHPYLWAMIVVLSIAAVARHAIVDRAYGTREVLLHLSGTVAASAVAGWTLGWLEIGAADRSAIGLGFYSMNLLGLFASNGWAALGPAIPVFEGQTYEGFNYPGAGVLAVAALAAVTMAARRPRKATVLAAVPVIVACTLMAIASLSPTITLGRRVLAEIPLPDRLQAWYAMFRATGRFFWPAGYLLSVGAIAVIVGRWRLAIALLTLTTAAGIQAFDLRSRYISNRAVRSNPAWYNWDDPTRDTYWSDSAVRYRHVVVVPPEACGQEPAPFAQLIYFAGSYGLTINSGSAARQSANALETVCRAAMDQVQHGRLQADTIYITAHPEALRAAARPVPLTCHPLAGATGCVLQPDAAGRSR
jgi:hypothetical protein